MSAGLLEIGWPVCLKMAQVEGQRVIGVIVALMFMFGSGYLLWLAQREIPMGTSYSVWTGIGGLRDLANLIRGLRSADRDFSDDGRVEHGNPVTKQP